MSSKAHVHRVFIILAGALVVGFAVQRLLQPRSFGQYGHYRGDSLVQLMARAPVHQGRAVCAECHEEIHAAHRKDVHFRVECEDCHGPGLNHVRYRRGEDPTITPAAATMPREYTLEGCLFCHRKLAARPKSFAQIDPKEHYAFLHVNDERTRCIECHSPHEPLFLPESVSEARVHPVIFECEDCHGQRPEASYRSVPDHPTIFVCGDCHPSVVRDFEKHEHAFMRCTACHLYYPENEVSGRVFKNGTRGFCLLCHERKGFKDATLPQIVSAEHIPEMAPVMLRDAESLRDDPTACLQCHFDYIHDTHLIRRLQEQER